MNEPEKKPPTSKYRHLLMCVSIGTFVAIVFLIQQIRLLIGDLFLQKETWLTIGLLTAALLAWLFALLLHFVFTTPQTERQKRIVEKIPNRLHSAIGWIHRRIIAWPVGFLYRQALRFRRFSESTSGYIIIVFLMVSGILMMFAMPVRLAPGTWLDWAWPLAGGFVQMLGVAFVAIGTWLFFGRYYGANTVLDPSTDDSTGESDSRQQKVWRRTGEVLSALLWLMIVLELAWVFAEHQLLGVTPSVYSVWSFFAIAAGATMLAGLIDFLDHNTSFRWRIASVAFIVVTLSLSGRVGLVSVAPPPSDLSATTAESESHHSDESRLESSRGSVDFWAEAAIQRLKEKPDGPVIIVTASGGGSRAALTTVLSLEETEAVCANSKRPSCIWLCSGVSGGGIALAAYFCPGPDQTSARDAVSADYLAPLFRGFLVPRQNRGESLTDYWDRKFKWDGINQLSTESHRPLLVYGVSDIDLGRRVMVGFPRLPTDWYQRWTTNDKDEWIISSREVLLGF